MAYKVIILYRLYMPSYFLGTFAEYPYVKVSPVLLGIDFTAASHSLFPDHKPFNHFFSEPQHGTELFHEKHFPEHWEPSESPVYDSGEP